MTDSAAPKLVSLYERQRKIYPRTVRGRFASWRWGFVALTQLLFYGLPWLPWNGRQAVLFDLAARRFYIFDLVLYPQDFIYLTGLLVLSAYSLFFFTAVAGRLWCGFSCPQTVYTEIFLWIEQRLEGERGARIKLDEGPWSADKLLRKGGKHAVWLALALWTGFTFVGYFTPIQVLAAEARQLQFGPWEWFWVLFYSLATYGNAGFLREQVCKYMCPYARFQSAMFDHDTLIVTYDAKRGEPRGTRARSADLAKENLGHCIDCKLCVHVCPTGIDIRKGLQYECIACTSCIDACDGVMDKMHYPRGLIRFDTQRAMAESMTPEQKRRHFFRPRVLIYGLVLVALAVAFVIGLTLRSPLKVDVVRDRATLARLVEGGQIENIYRLQLMNATESAQRYEVRVDGIEGAQLVAATVTEVGPAEARWVTLAVRVPHASARALGAGAHPIRFQIHVLGTERQVHERSTFVVPRL